MFVWPSVQPAIADCRLAQPAPIYLAADHFAACLRVEPVQQRESA